MSTDDRYNGWANRETWAVALHINNDQGWQESVLDALRQYIADPRSQWGDEDVSELSRWREAGEIIRANVEEMLSGDGEATDFSGESMVTYYPWQDMARDDIGSLWRVDWTEIGASFLEQLGEED